MSDSIEGWRLPGSPAIRRAAIYGTAAKVVARYGGVPGSWRLFAVND